MRQKITYFLGGIMLTFLAFWSLDVVSEAPTAIKGPLPQIIQPITLKGNYAFANEPLPMEKRDVQERLDRELTINSYRHSSTLDYLKLMNRYFPKIESILTQEGIPDDFKYLAVAESGLRNVGSPAGAKGFWQFMKPTAKHYNLIVASDIDERYNLEKSTKAACRYLKDLYNQFGSWTLAAAAYNMGPSALKEEMELQKEDSYYALNLSQETLRYIFRIVAMKELHEHAETYGFFVDQHEKYNVLGNTYEVAVNYSIPSLSDFAHKNGIDYRTLKRFNPWMLDNKLVNNTGRTYYFTFPKNIND